MAFSYGFGDINTAPKEDSFFSTQPHSPDALYNFPSTKSFKVHNSFSKSPNDNVEPHSFKNGHIPDLSSNNANKLENGKSKYDVMKQTKLSRERVSANPSSDEEQGESDYSDSFISESPDMAKRKAEKIKTTFINCGMVESEALWLHLSQQQQMQQQQHNNNNMSDTKMPKLWSRLWKNPKQWQQSFPCPFSAPKKHPPRKEKHRRNGSSTNATKDSETKRRLMSAHRVKIKDMNNRLESMKCEMKDIVDENRLLKRLQRKQEKALVEFNSQEGELPLLLQRHHNEVSTLREHLRKVRDKHTSTERMLRTVQQDLHNKQQMLEKYRVLAEEKDLPERDKLLNKVAHMENETKSKERKIEELKRYIENLTKNHKHQLNLEVSKNHDAQQALDLLQESFANLQLSHKEKEKELDIRNIYSNRIARPPHMLPISYEGTPIHNLSAHDKDAKTYGSLSDLSPRMRAKEYANKLRADEFRKRDKLKRKQTVDTKNEVLPPFPAMLKRNTDERNILDDLENNRLERIESKKREEEERRMAEKKLEKERLELQRQREENKAQNELDLQRHQALEWERQMMEIKKKREEQEKVEALEKKQREEELRIREEERRRIEMEKEERMLQEERNAAEKALEEERKRMETDPYILEARRQKDMLLAKMRAIDDSMPEMMKSIQENSGNRKNYNFTSVTENLHQGKPSHDNVTVPYLEKQKHTNGFYDAKDDSNESSPSFDFLLSKNKPPTEAHKSQKKTKLLEELFGADGSLNKPDQNGYVPSASKPKSRSKKHEDLGNYGSEKQKRSSAVGSRETSSIVAGGNILLDSYDSFEEDLPYKPKKPKDIKYTGKPLLGMIDTNDDDIEEMII